MPRRNRRFNPGQARDAKGRWKKGYGSPGVKVKGKTVGNPTGADTKGVATGKGFIHRNAQAASAYFTDRKGNFTAADSPKKKPKAPGKIAPANVVPYARVGNRAASVGVDGGIPLGRHFRLSGGGYVRISRNKQTGAEKNLAHILHGVQPILKNTKLGPLLAGQVEVGQTGATARLGTSQNALPSIKVKKGYSRVSNEKSAEAIADYNAAMVKKIKGKKTRPQRRNSNP